jgi:cephalosporin-C deacetylase-like acetyl esterase
MNYGKSMSFIPVFLILLILLITDSECQDSPDQRKTGQPIKPTTYEATDFEMNPQLEIREHGNNYSLIIKKFLAFARAQRYFCGESAQYNITLYYLDHFLGEPSINVFVDETKVDSIKFNKPEHGERDLYTESFKTFPDINIRKWSRIAFDIKNDVPVERTDRLHIKRIVFTPAGPFQGDRSELNNPEPLRIYETIDKQKLARAMLSRFLESAVNPINEARLNELKKLDTSLAWKKKQGEIRSRIHEYFGEFPGRTPLNAKIVGIIERDKYIIEKLIFESQPNYFCAANFYIPKDRPLPVPGVLITIGHKELGKSRPMYHELGVGLALKGYAALAMDPMGQGERSEYFDTAKRIHLLERKTDQHHYFGRQAFLADWTLASRRVWDCLRAVDYLVSRAEVDSSKLAVVGNSGGGEMAMFITAVDQRIKVCAAGHPGGSCESMLLNGMSPSVFDIYSLIPPRPCRIIVGRESREAPGHMGTIELLRPIYDALTVPEEALDMSIVDGLHDIKKPKRESVYAWFNKWFDKGNEDSIEQPFQTEEMESLWCAESGFTLLSFGGETAQSLCAKRGEQIYKPEKDLVKLKERVAKRIGLVKLQKPKKVKSKSAGTLSNEQFNVEKVIIESEKGINNPGLLIKPKNNEKHKFLVLHVSDQGKPTVIDRASIPLALVSAGFEVLSIDVRGIGETDPSPPILLTKYTGRPEPQWQRDVLAINSLSINRTMLGMRTLDVFNAIHYIQSRDDLQNKSIAVIGEGLGGLWALLAASYNSEVDAVACIGTLPSYKLLLNSHYYNVWNYFWVPGAH